MKLGRLEHLAIPLSIGILFLATRKSRTVQSLASEGGEGGSYCYFLPGHRQCVLMQKPIFAAPHVETFAKIKILTKKFETKKILGYRKF